VFGAGDEAQGDGGWVAWVVAEGGSGRKNFHDEIVAWDDRRRLKGICAARQSESGAALWSLSLPPLCPGVLGSK
jgi:hypothetical protein